MKPYNKIIELKVGEKNYCLSTKPRGQSQKPILSSKVHFDVGKHIHFVPPFQEFEVDK